jgi:hypothetical protein
MSAVCKLLHDFPFSALVRTSPLWLIDRRAEHGKLEAMPCQIPDPARPCGRASVFFYLIFTSPEVGQARLPVLNSAVS